MIIQSLTDRLLAVEEVVAAFLRVSLFAALLVGIRIFRRLRPRGSYQLFRIYLRTYKVLKFTNPETASAT